MSAGARAQRFIGPLAMVGCLCALRWLISLPTTARVDPVADATLAAGFLLLTAYIGGKLFRDLGLPSITGYILIGVLVGPGVLDLVTDMNIGDLRVINDIAISLIALAAGGELKMSELRSRGKQMTGIMTMEMIAVFTLVFVTMLLVSDLLPFTAGRDMATVATIAMIFGSIAIANSPTVAIAVITETRARGPVASTILGVTVMKDVVVILFFAVALAAARAILNAAGSLDVGFLLDLGWEIGGSILLGALIGVVVSLYLKFINRHLALFTLAVAIVSANLAQTLHLEVLLLSLSAGFFVENVSPVHGEPFVQGIEANAVPLYALFFSLAGASIHLDVLAELWPFALLLVSVRAVAVFSGTRLGANMTNAEPEVRRYAWYGFISQAGVTLGMVIIAGRAFPEWGAEMRTLFVSMVAIHELVGPVLLHHALRQAGEIGAGIRGKSAVERTRAKMAEARG